MLWLFSYSRPLRHASCAFTRHPFPPLPSAHIERARVASKPPHRFLQLTSSPPSWRLSPPRIFLPTTPCRTSLPRPGLADVPQSARWYIFPGRTSNCNPYCSNRTRQLLSIRNPIINENRLRPSPPRGLVASVARHGCGLKMHPRAQRNRRHRAVKRGTNRVSVANAFAPAGSAKCRTDDSVVRVAVECIQKLRFARRPFDSRLSSPSARRP